jgi:uncharacterized membrane protein YbhN (UPF0104 family)
MIVFLRRVDWHTTSLYLRQLGSAAPLVLIPYACSLCCDTLGWKTSFEHPRRLPFTQLLRLRVATEALSNSLPGGMAVGETLKTVLLTRSFGIALSDAAANVIVSKFALALAHVVFLFCGLWLGASLLAQPGHPGLLDVYLAVVFGFFTLLVVGVKLAQSSSLSRVLESLLRVLPARAGELLSRLHAPAVGLDTSLAVIGRLPRAQLAASVSYFFLGWLVMGCENWLILSLLSPHATFSTALSMEAVVSIVRMAFFFVPAGFGAQDVSYYALLNLSGIPDAHAVATAFMLLKRAKEACWIALGYLLLWLRSTTGTRDQRSLAL